MKRGQNKNYYYYLVIITFFLLVIFYSNSLLHDSDNYVSNQLIKIQFYSPDLDFLALFFPFLAIILATVIMYFYYSDQVQRKNIRRMGKLSLIAFAFLSSIFIYQIAIQGTPEQEDNSGENGNTSTDSTTTSNISASTASTPPIENTELKSEILDSNIPLIDLLDLVSENLTVLVIIGLGMVVILIIRTQARPPEMKIFKKNKFILARYKSNDEINKQVLARYLEISDILEQEGANSSFSLTPKEFELDVDFKIDKKQLKISQKEINRITELFEMARFGTSRMTKQDLDDVEEIYEKIIKIYSSYKISKEFIKKEDI